MNSGFKFLEECSTKSSIHMAMLQLVILIDLGEFICRSRNLGKFLRHGLMPGNGNIPFPRGGF